MEVTLGTKVRDSITGLTGVAVSRTVYLNGCVRFGVQPQVVKDGKVADVEYVDAEQLEEVKPESDMPAAGAGSASPGGPAPAPRDQPAPR